MNVCFATLRDLMGDLIVLSRDLDIDFYRLFFIRIDCDPLAGSQKEFYARLYRSLRKLLKCKNKHFHNPIILSRTRAN